MSHYEFSGDSDSEREPLCDHREVAGRLNQVEENGLYVRNLLNHMNDKLFQPVKRSVVPAVALGFSVAGTLGTVALGIGFLLVQLHR